MNPNDTLSACHHRFRFLLEEMSDESGDVLKKNRLVEEFKNEIVVFCSVSASFFTDATTKKYSDNLNVKDFNGKGIECSLEELDPMANDNTKWRNGIKQLKTEVENLLYQYENSMGTHIYNSLLGPTT